MTPNIILYGLRNSRSARVQWTLLELGLQFEIIEDRALLGSAQLRCFHPQGKVPVVVIDGEPLFESTAICTHLCDLVPEAKLISVPSSRERALHEQWTSFVLTEMEAYLWSNLRHQHLYSEKKRVPAIVEINCEEFQNGAKVLEDIIAKTPYLIDGKFSVTDIIVGYTVNWGRQKGQLDGFDHLHAYLRRLFDRDQCTLDQR